MSFSARARLALIDWAVRRNAVIIEDDYNAEFRYDRDPVGPTPLQLGAA
jgi:GntR family transcriptional regulator/MocR family aminotransferase